MDDNKAWLPPQEQAANGQLITNTSIPSLETGYLTRALDLSCEEEAENKLRAVTTVRWPVKQCLRVGARNESALDIP